MRSATRVTVASFGTLAGLAGIEHGIGEILQGNRAPAGLVIQSWPDAEFFRILNGEPALTIVPNLRLTGILAIGVSLLFLVWTTVFVQRKYGGVVLMLLSLILLLVGGGFGPPLLGVILGLVATRINAPLARAHTVLSPDLLRWLSALWPWSLTAGVMAWLFLMPGSLLIHAFVGMTNPDWMVTIAMLAAFSLLFTTIVTGFARDLQRQTGALHVRPGSGQGVGSEISSRSS
ncbi:MAG TPA: hypothetical protein VGD58_30135 [Herpetosiphonaceae bacterium]